MLVGLVLLGMLAVILHSAVLDGVRYTKTIAERSDRQGEIALAQNFLRERIAALGPAPERSSEADLAWFEGGEQSLSITTPWLEALPAAGLYALEFEMGPGTQRSGALVLRWRPALTASGGTALPMGERTLLDDVRRIDFAYFGVASPGEEASWYRSWRSEDRAPDLVRVDVEFVDPSRRWPTLNVAIP